MTDRLGQLMISIEGTALDGVTRERLCHPDVGGVIIFSRNYENLGQLRDLCRSIRELRSPSLDRKSTRLNSSHSQQSRMPSSA